ncbi:MAG: DUF1559 domain-containing protein, partial [Planctomycetia bacterium]
LVTIGIIGVLIAILLPAVQAAREASRRMSCINNLHQLAIATASYESAHRYFPAAGMVDFSQDGFQCRTGKMLSWVTLILPFCEQEALYNQIDFNYSAIDQPGEPLAEQPNILLCPSDSARGRYLIDSDLTGGRRLAKGNYAAYVGPYHVDNQMEFPAIIVGRGMKASAITDGLSSTLLLSEVRTRDQESDQRGVWSLSWPAATLLSVDLHHLKNPHGARYYPSSYTDGKGQVPNTQGPVVEPIYMCENRDEAKASEMPCLTYGAGWATKYLSAPPRSLHPGGVNAAMGDGRVIFLSNEINERVLAYMACSFDGTIIDRTEYSQ